MIRGSSRARVMRLYIYPGEQNVLPYLVVHESELPFCCDWNGDAGWTKSLLRLPYSLHLLWLLPSANRKCVSNDAPLLPASLTQLSQGYQLLDHEERFAQLERELLDHYYKMTVSLLLEFISSFQNNFTFILAAYSLRCYFIRVWLLITILMKPTWIKLSF